MKSNNMLIILLLGIGAIIIMLYKNHSSEELVTESAPVSTLSYDEEIAKIPFETATFGMG